MQKRTKCLFETAEWNGFPFFTRLDLSLNFSDSIKTTDTVFSFFALNKINYIKQMYFIMQHSCNSFLCSYNYFKSGWYSIDAEHPPLYFYPSELRWKGFYQITKQIVSFSYPYNFINPVHCNLFNQLLIFKNWEKYDYQIFIFIIKLALQLYKNTFGSYSKTIYFFSWL